MQETLEWYGPVDVYVSCLTDPMAPVLCLGVHCGIPVTVIKYHSICTSEVHSNTSRTCRQNEAKYSLILIEPIHKYLQKSTFIEPIIL